MTKPQKILTALFLFFIFVVLSYFVQKRAFTSFDFDTTVRLQDKINRNFDTFLSTLSLFGSLEVSAIILLIILAVKRNLGLFLLIPFRFSQSICLNFLENYLSGIRGLLLCFSVMTLIFYFQVLM